jgi:uncharacterized protein (DUF427 family)
MLRVEFAGVVVAETRNGVRLLETSHPPSYYFPPDDVQRQYLESDPGRTFCEFKGFAKFWTLDANGRRARQAAWSYPLPDPSYGPLKDHFAFYAARVDACWVGEERVTAQEGDFYGGWITSNIVGPFKGGPGTIGW